MEKALEFYTQLTDILNMDISSKSTPILNGEFSRIVRENMGKLTHIIEDQMKRGFKDDSTSDTPHQTKCGTYALAVLIKNKRRTQDDRALIIQNLEYYTLEGVDSLKVIIKYAGFN